MHLLLAAVIAVVGVNVVPMDSERVLLGQTVIVEGDRVVAIGPVNSVPVPDGAQVTYADGRWLVPGLADMHVHLLEADLPRYLENGVTTVQDMAGVDTVLALVRRGNGPRIIPLGKLFTGPNPQTPYFARPVTRVQDAAAAVDEQLARGCVAIKVYDGLSREVYDAIVNAAHQRGVKVAGHVSQNVPISHAMTMQDSIEHLSGYPIGSQAHQLAVASRDAGVWNCPTMAVFTQTATANMSEPARTAFLAGRRALLIALHDAGARVLAGTDAGYLLPAGTSLHDELAELRAAGFTPYEALAAATRSAGEYLGDPALGVIVEGAHADLLLVRDNPLEDLDTLRQPVEVMLRGHWLGHGRRRSAGH